jgi:hypothetical protein
MTRECSSAVSASSDGFRGWRFSEAVEVKGLLRFEGSGFSTGLVWCEKHEPILLLKIAKRRYG